MQPRACQRCGPKADRRLFGQIVINAESRKLKMRYVLAYSLSNNDGSRHKTNIAVLARELEKNVSPAEEISEPSATVIDRMSVVQKLNQTFLQLAESAVSHVLHEGPESHRVDVVFDVYREMSIKDSE